MSSAVRSVRFHGAHSNVDVPSLVLIKTYLIMLLVLRIVVVLYEIIFVQKTFSLLTFLLYYSEVLSITLTIK